MNKTAIEWCDYTWNPVTGCQRNCFYCYARGIHNRFNKTPFSEITVHRDRFSDPKKIKYPSTIFVGSMSDIEFWPQGVTGEIISITEECPQHTFMFLSKNPNSYHGFRWSPNTMQGVTMTCDQCAWDQLVMVQTISRYPRPFISIEPLSGEIFPNNFDKIEKIIIGAMTGPKAKRPSVAAILSINALPSVKVFIKNNMSTFYQGNHRSCGSQEYSL
jgi:protein gp37